MSGRARRLLSPRLRQTVRRRAARICAASVCPELAGAEWSVLLTDDDEVRELNRRYRDIDATTDVLSFAQGEGEGLCDTIALGDVVISVEQAGRQAAGGDMVAEIVRLLVHGLCHLRGLDHARRGDARRMRAEEERLLGVVGIG